MIARDIMSYQEACKVHKCGRLPPKLARFPVTHPRDFSRHVTRGNNIFMLSMEFYLVIAQ